MLSEFCTPTDAQEICSNLLALELDFQIAAHHLCKGEYFTNQKRQRYEIHDIQ
jgi:hypothetical protein